MLAVTYQLLPELTEEEYEALKADIALHGIQVPIEVDEEGNVLDGYHRLRAAQELGLPDEAIPKVVRAGLTEDQKREHALRMNLLRRQLTREQKQQLAVQLRQQGWTQTRIAQVLGVSQATVHNWLEALAPTVELPEVILDTLGRPQAARKVRRYALEDMPASEEASEPEPEVALTVPGEAEAEPEPEPAAEPEVGMEAEEPEPEVSPEVEPDAAAIGEPSANLVPEMVPAPGVPFVAEQADEVPVSESSEPSGVMPEASEAVEAALPPEEQPGHVISLDNALSYLLACQPKGFPAPSRLEPEEYAMAVSFAAALNVLRHTYERDDRGRKVLRAWRKWMVEQGQEGEIGRATRLLEAMSRYIRTTLGLRR